MIDARAGGDIVRVRGHKGVRAVQVADGTTVECDLLVTATGWTAPGRPAQHGRRRARLRPAGGQVLPREPAARRAGHGRHRRGRRPRRADRPRPGGRPRGGAPRGPAAPGMAGGRAHPRRRRRPARRRRAGGSSPQLPVDAHPELFRARTHGIVDFCEDVSSKDIIAAVREGYDSIELAKRYTTATMGPTQGKIELVNAIAVRPRPPAGPSRRPAPRPGGRRTRRSRSARWPAGRSSRCGTRRCSPGTRRTTRAR